MSEVSSLPTKLNAAETNIADLSDAIYTTCNILDRLGALQTTGNEIDCCILAGTTAGTAFRDRFVCISRNTADLAGIDTSAHCPVCPPNFSSWMVKMS